MPTGRKGKRVRFSREYTDRLKERAHEARLRGITNIIGVAAGTGPIVGAVQIRRSRMSPEQRARATLWKLQHTVRRRNPRPKAVEGAPVKPRPVRVLTPEETEARARLAADRAKLAEDRAKRKPEAERQAVIISMSVHRPYIEPESRDQALETLRWLLKLVRAHPGEDAVRIEHAVDGLRVALVRGSTRKLTPRLIALKEVIPCAQNLESQCVTVVHKALTNLVAWCERSGLLTPPIRKRRGRRKR